MISTLMPGSVTDNSTISMKSANVKIECYKSSKAKIIVHDWYQKIDNP